MLTLAKTAKTFPSALRYAWSSVPLHAFINLVAALTYVTTHFTRSLLLSNFHGPTSNSVVPCTSASDFGKPESGENRKVFMSWGGVHCSH